MATFEIGTGYKKTTWCSAEIICRGDCPQFTDSGTGVIVYHLYNVTGCNYISKSSLIVDIKYKGTTTWEPWESYTMGGYEGFVYYYIEITDGIDCEFRATYKGITKYYSIVAPCVPNWQCELPLNGYEADGCGDRRYNEACIDQCEGVICPDICVDTDLWYQKCESTTGNCVLDTIHFNAAEECGAVPIIICRKGCAIDGSYDYYTGNRIDGECEVIENSELCGYIPPEEPEESEESLKYLLYGGLGLAVLFGLKKLNKK